MNAVSLPEEMDAGLKSTINKINIELEIFYLHRKVLYSPPCVDFDEQLPRNDSPIFNS
jgi:hypothetical protein